MAKNNQTAAPMGIVAKPLLKGRQGFHVWGSSIYHDVRLVGGHHYQRSYIAIFEDMPDTSEGIRLKKTAELVNEPHNPNDPNAVSVYVDGLMVGYMARDDASYFGPMVGAIRRSGFAALCGIQLWFRVRQEQKYIEVYDGYWKTTLSREVEGETEPSYSCGAQLALHGRNAIYPLNAFPEGNYIAIPPGRVINVYDVDKSCGTYSRLMESVRMSKAGDIAAYATLTIGTDGKRPRAVVNVDGEPVGRLSIPMSKDFVPLIERELAEYDAVAVELHVESDHSCILNVMRPFETGLSPFSRDDCIKPHERFATIADIDLRQYPDRFIYKKWSEKEGRYIPV